MRRWIRSSRRSTSHELVSGIIARRAGIWRTVPFRLPCGLLWRTDIRRAVCAGRRPGRSYRILRDLGEKLRCRSRGHHDRLRGRLAAMEIVIWIVKGYLTSWEIWLLTKGSFKRPDLT